MLVYTDNTDYADSVLDEKPNWRETRQKGLNKNIQPLAAELIRNNAFYRGEINRPGNWKHLFVLEFTPVSQYDILIRISRSEAELPDGILCLAESGENFHGYKNRPWISLPGNIHLSAYLSPNQQVEHFTSGFIILSAVSVIQTIDSIKELTGKASVKWVNDIVIDSKKICGVLANTKTMGNIITGAVLGIGLNVEITPQIPPGRFNPSAASLFDFVTEKNYCSQKIILDRLINTLDDNYQRLLKNKYSNLLNIYQERSFVIGKRVRVFSDTPTEQSEEIAQGKVTGLGDNLELLIEGMDHPITAGRIVIEDGINH